jgi:hypothetical protein
MSIPLKTRSALKTQLSIAERLLWEKYNKPNRNLFEALTAFENNGVGRKVVSLLGRIDNQSKNAFIDHPRCLFAGRRKVSRIVITR